MRIQQTQWSEPAGWQTIVPAPPNAAPQLVLFFAGSAVWNQRSVIDELRAQHPGAHVIGCSTAGEICGTRVEDNTLVAIAVQFDSTRLHAAYAQITDPACSAAVGAQLAREMPADGLVHAFVLAEGLHVNGSELAAGLRSGLPPSVAVTGGLAGDGDAFRRTTVYLDGRSDDGGVALLGFYGEDLRVGYGSLGGWDSFGPERLVTRAEGNVLYELDGRSALGLYKEYLGPYAESLPASGLLFPLSLRGDESELGVVRTILGIDEGAGSLTFAGDIPAGRYVRLMKANVDRLIDGAHAAAGASYHALDAESPELAILISCVGRKLVLKQRVEEEPESVRQVLGETTVLGGFYSYGEIAPFAKSVKCELHNQTMTITSFSERKRCA